MIADQPVFIGGMMRSGTTLMRAMLGQHSQLAAGLETFWFDVNPIRGIARGGEDIAPYVERLAAYLELPNKSLQEVAKQAVSAADFLDQTMAAYAASLGKPRWVEKTPANVFHTDAIFGAWPDAHFIVMTRDPRAVFASFYGTPKEMTPIKFIEQWGQSIRAGDLALELYGPERISEVPYEKLVHHPETIMQSVAAFIGVTYESAMSTFAGQEKDFSTVRRVANHESNTLRQLAKPLDAARTGAWRDRLPNNVTTALLAAAQADGMDARFGNLITSAEAVV